MPKCAVGSTDHPIHGVPKETDRENTGRLSNPNGPQLMYPGALAQDTQAGA
jgi:hypothetical protein